MLIFHFNEEHRLLILIMMISINFNDFPSRFHVKTVKTEDEAFVERNFMEISANTKSNYELASLNRL
jgi:hypothetical protein